MTIETKQEYQWNQNWADPIAHTDVNVVVDELKQIQEIRGEITPKHVVDSARNKKSALHGYFIWDDAVAANKYRMQKASELIGRIEIKIVKDGEAKIIKAFDITTTSNLSQPVSYTSSSSSSSSRAKQVATGDLNKIINRLEPFDEYKVVVSWLRKTAILLSGIKESTEIQEAKVIESKEKLSKAV